MSKRVICVGRVFPAVKNDDGVLVRERDTIVADDESKLFDPFTAIRIVEYLDLNGNEVNPLGYPLGFEMEFTGFDEDVDF